MRNKPSIDEVAEAYTAFAVNSWAQEYLMLDLLRRQPDEAWAVIVRLIEIAPNEEVAALVAAVPLQDFVIVHGEQYLEAVSAAARTSLKMQRALGGFWGESQMPKKEWKQIQKIAGLA